MTRGEEGLSGGGAVFEDWGCGGGKGEGLQIGRVSGKAQSLPRRSGPLTRRLSEEKSGLSPPSPSVYLSPLRSRQLRRANIGATEPLRAASPALLHLHGQKIARGRLARLLKNESVECYECTYTALAASPPHFSGRPPFAFPTRLALASAEHSERCTREQAQHNA